MNFLNRFYAKEEKKRYYIYAIRIQKLLTEIFDSQFQMFDTFSAENRKSILTCICVELSVAIVVVAFKIKLKPVSVLNGTAHFL